MKTKQIVVLIGTLGLATSLFASADAEKIFDAKCAVCHIKTMPTNRTNMIAPALMGVMRHLKMAYPNKEDAVNFMVGYVQNPTKEKAICMQQKIARFGLMPSQKGNITPEELEEVTEWMFDNFPPANFKGQGMQNRMGQMRNSNRLMGIGRNRSTFSDFDLNKDGVITKVELHHLRAQKQEARAKAGYPMRNVANAPSFESVDSNGDEKITPDEFNNRFN